MAVFHAGIGIQPIAAQTDTFLLREHLPLDAGLRNGFAVGTHNGSLQVHRLTGQHFFRNLFIQLDALFRQNMNLQLVNHIAGTSRRVCGTSIQCHITRRHCDQLSILNLGNIGVIGITGNPLNRRGIACVAGLHIINAQGQLLTNFHGDVAVLICHGQFAGNVKSGHGLDVNIDEQILGGISVLLGGNSNFACLSAGQFVVFQISELVRNLPFDAFHFKAVRIQRNQPAGLADSQLIASVVIAGQLDSGKYGSLGNRHHDRLGLIAGLLCLDGNSLAEGGFLCGHQTGVVHSHSAVLGRPDNVQCLPISIDSLQLHRSAFQHLDSGYSVILFVLDFKGLDDNGDFRRSGGVAVLRHGDGHGGAALSDTLQEAIGNEGCLIRIRAGPLDASHNVTIAVPGNQFHRFIYIHRAHCIAALVGDHKGVCLSLHVQSRSSIQIGLIRRSRNGNRFANASRQDSHLTGIVNRNGVFIAAFPGNIGHLSAASISCQLIGLANIEAVLVAISLNGQEVLLHGHITSDSAAALRSRNCSTAGSYTGQFTGCVHGGGTIVRTCPFEAGLCGVGQVPHLQIHSLTNLDLLNLITIGIGNSESVRHDVDHTGGILVAVLLGSDRDGASLQALDLTIRRHGSDGVIAARPLNALNVGLQFEGAVGIHLGCSRSDGYLLGSGRIGGRNSKGLLRTAAIECQRDLRRTSILGLQSTGPLIDGHNIRAGYVSNRPFQGLTLNGIQVLAGEAQIQGLSYLQLTYRGFLGIRINNLQLFRLQINLEALCAGFGTIPIRYLNRSRTLFVSLQSTTQRILRRERNASSLCGPCKLVGNFPACHLQLKLILTNDSGSFRACNRQLACRQRRYGHHGQNHDDHQKHRQYPFLHVNCLLDNLVAIACNYLSRL